MRIVVNGKPEERPDGLTVADLLSLKKLGEMACAVEVNRTLVPKAHHGEHHLQEGDLIEIVTLVGGG